MEGGQFRWMEAKYILWVVEGPVCSLRKLARKGNTKPGKTPMMAKFQVQ